MLIRGKCLSFEAEQSDTRLARRKRSWIPDVAIK
jgi:hypothetical protein